MRTWLIALLTPWPGVGTGSLHAPPPQSSVDLHGVEGFAWHRPTRVISMLASTFAVSVASTLPEIVPVENGMRVASSLIMPLAVLRTSLRVPT